MNIDTKVKGNVVIDGCSTKNFTAISNEFFGLWNESKVTLVYFNCDISNKYIRIGAAKIIID